MKRSFLIGLVLAALCSALAFGAPASTLISGDYVEVRTASVFAGACHFNGEVVTTGREAVMAWNIKSGTWKGTNLAGVRAIAAVSAEANLGDAKATRKSEMVVDSAATDAQASALIEALQSRHGEALGKVVSVRRAPVTFNHEGKMYFIDAPGFAAYSVEGMPNDECCKMPNLVWYSPLVPLSNRKVGYTMKASFAGGSIGEAWQRSGENSAFYGSFSL